MFTGAVLLLAFVYAYFFTDWFKPPHIQISAQPRPNWSGPAGLPFRLDGKYRLTEVKVVPLYALETNKSCSPVWHMVKSSNVTTTAYFFYGAPIEGMKAASDKPAADPLEPDTAYRLSVEAGRARGELDFHTPPAAAD